MTRKEAIAVVCIDVGFLFFRRCFLMPPDRSNAFLVMNAGEQSEGTSNCRRWDLLKQLIRPALLYPSLSVRALT